VVSIILLIFSPNLIRILIGWDGLGIRSYLLVIYYTTQKSYNAGIITFARNRIGDALIIITISYFIYLEKLNIFLIHYRVRLEYSWVIIVIIIAGFTKRAQIPFRA
jgi:NADH-ubiquinone oxidoreductase chain 5